MTHVHVAICRSWHVLVAMQFFALAETSNVSPVMTSAYALIQIKWSETLEVDRFVQFRPQPPKPTVSPANGATVELTLVSKVALN